MTEDEQALVQRVDELLGTLPASERRAQLTGQPHASAPRNQADPARSAGMLATLALLGPAALAVRIGSWPLRRHYVPKLRRERRERRLVAMQRAVAVVERATTLIEAEPPLAPPAIDARFERGLALMVLERPAQADVDFDACVAALTDAAPRAADGVTLAQALAQRAEARDALGLSELADADRERARDLGVPEASVGARMRQGAGKVGGFFRLMAGWV